MQDKAMSALPPNRTSAYDEGTSALGHIRTLLWVVNGRIVFEAMRTQGRI